MIGYVALYRKIQDHPFYKEKREFSKYEAWIDILMEVQHSDEAHDVIFGMKILKCYYGESLKSLKTWAKRWNWSPSKVKRYFELLKKMERISIKNETVTTRLKVLNYELYDPKRNASKTQVKRKRNANDFDVVTDNNVNNVKNVNNIILKDETFYEITPDFLKMLEDTYKNINVLSELKNIAVWNYSNKSKRKTKAGIKRHINSWLDRSNKKNNNDAFSFLED